MGGRHPMSGSTRPRSGWTLAIVSIALFMTALDNLVVGVALPSIRHDLGGSLESLEWTVNAYTLSFAVLLITGAALGDRFGRKRIFALGVAVFTTASALAALAPSIDALIAARAVQGAGAAMVLPLTLTLLSEAVAPEKRGMALGIWAAVSGLGVALGPLVGGAVVQGIAWQWIFWLNVPIGIVLLPLAVRLLTESHGPEDRLDLPGLALAAAGLRRDVRDHPLDGARLGLGHGARLADRRRRRAGRLHRLGAARPGADAPDAVLPLARLLGHQRHHVRHVLRRLRLDLPALAVLPDGPGVLAVRSRPAHAAVDGDADVHRADRRPAERPDRVAAADGCRPGAAGGGDLLARPGVLARGRLREPGRAAGARRHGHGARVRAVGQRRARRRAPGGGRPGLGGGQRHPRAGRRDGRGGAGLGVQRERLLRLAAGVQRRRRGRAAARRRRARARRGVRAGDPRLVRAPPGHRHARAGGPARAGLSL